MLFSVIYHADCPNTVDILDYGRLYPGDWCA
jgi:hypothetical protein